MVPIEKILFLRNVSVFEGLTSKDLAQVASIAEEVDCAAGVGIIWEGEQGDAMFVIVTGDVRISRRGKDVAVLRAKEYFGEMSILDGERRSASASALTTCHLLRIQQKDFHQILAQHLEAALAIIKVLCRRLRTELDRPSRLTG
jgi:CRP/FNR family transcriptional regulator, cyclic AMP receptor protein